MHRNVFMAGNRKMYAVIHLKYSNITELGDDTFS
jgi:hypothetical protein